MSTSFIVDNIQITDPKLIADNFCTFFTEIGKKHANRIPKSKKGFHYYMKENIRDSIFMAPTNINEINNIIRKLKPKKSCGLDNITSNLLKQIAPTISEPLTQIINKSLQNGIFPENWKSAKISPIYKSKKKNIHVQLPTHFFITYSLKNNRKSCSPTPIHILYET